MRPIYYIDRVSLDGKILTGNKTLKIIKDEKALIVQVENFSGEVKNIFDGDLCFDKETPKIYSKDGRIKIYMHIAEK